MSVTAVKLALRSPFDVVNLSTCGAMHCALRGLMIFVLYQMIQQSYFSRREHQCRWSVNFNMSGDTATTSLGVASSTPKNKGSNLLKNVFTQYADSRAEAPLFFSEKLSTTEHQTE